MSNVMTNKVTGNYDATVDTFQKFDSRTKSSAYKMTGNQIPINVPVLVQFVHSKLREYDDLVSHGVIPQESPYTTPIVYTMEDQRQIEIPQEIQNKAIASYLAYVNTHLDSGKRLSENMAIVNNSNLKPHHHHSILNIPKKGLKQIEEDVENNHHLIFIIILIIIAIACYYYRMNNPCGSFF
jgi:hypothetical protein